MAGKKSTPNAYNKTAKSVERVIDAIDRVNRSFEALAENWYALPKEVRDANPSLAAWFELQRRNPDRGSPFTEFPLN
jgi:hypothetical protein